MLSVICPVLNGEKYITNNPLGVTLEHLHLLGIIWICQENLINIE